MIEAVLAGMFGLLIGSFLNVCIYRMPRDLSIVHPRSFCPKCEKQVAWYDNIPVLSWLVLRGKCRNCATPIPIRYPMVELITGLLFFSFVGALGATPQGFKFCLYAALLVGLIFTDIEERILPDEFTLGGTVIGLILAWFIPLSPDLIAFFLALSGNTPDPRVASLIEALVGAVVPSVMIWLVGVLYQAVRKREGLGFGDVKMLAFMGAFLGLRLSLLVFFVGSMLGAVTGLAFILITRKEMSTYELPLGTFLGISGLFCAMYTEGVFAWYMKLLG